MKEHIIHPIPPFYDKESEILILGSFPSVKSREQQFFYGHKQNRFWKVIAHVFDDEVPDTIDEKKAFLKRHHIALYMSVLLGPEYHGNGKDENGGPDSGFEEKVPVIPERTHIVICPVGRFPGCDFSHCFRMECIDEGIPAESDDNRKKNHQEDGPALSFQSRIINKEESNNERKEKTVQGNRTLA